MDRALIAISIFKHVSKVNDGTSRFCRDCPIAGTDYCHKLNPLAKKYTRYEKIKLREEMDKGQTAYTEV